MIDKQLGRSGLIRHVATAPIHRTQQSAGGLVRPLLRATSSSLVPRSRLLNPPGAAAVDASREPDLAQPGVKRERRSARPNSSAGDGTIAFPERNRSGGPRADDAYGDEALASDSAVRDERFSRQAIVCPDAG
jgi:hypothetical protein